jgi:threonyl-tRNA synthetase
MHGLTRVRQFTITEAHIILTPEQAEEELTRCVDLAHYVMKTLGVDGDVTYRLSKWDPENKSKYEGDDNYWNSTQQYLRDVMNKNSIKFTEADGEAAFYGPKIDIQAKNVYGKEDTMVTIQLDCSSAQKFGMVYTDENGNKVSPWIIHRTSMGCYERTLAWLIEHYAGKFPTWMCPEQVRVLPISEKYEDYAQKVLAELKKNGIDATCDSRSEKIGYKIRETRNDRIPYWLVVGEKEEAEGLVAVSSRWNNNEGSKSLSEFIEQISEEIRNKTIRTE